MEEVIIRLEDVVKKFGQVLAVDCISMEVLAGEFFSILGPSGCGKTTLLRSIAGLENPDSGAIYLRGNLINHIPPYRRDVNMVFQNYALFPHMNVYENISFGLKMKKLKKGNINERVSESLGLVGLSGMETRKVNQLSGGQQQRVALARALVNEPSVLLLDEPLGALDLKLRKQMQIELKSLQKRLGITFIYVTHDQEEALTMSDRIAVMCAGKVEQLGTPSQIYEEPNTEFVANFIGVSNFFYGDLSRSDDSTMLLMAQDGTGIRVFANGNNLPESATAMVRPEKMWLTHNRPEKDVNVLQGTIEEILYLGTIIQFIVNINGRKLTILEKNYNITSDFRIDQEVFVSWDISSTIILPGS